METNRIKELLNKEVFLRILSILIAILLWGYVSFVLDPETQKEFTNIPVRFINEQVLLSSGITLVNTDFTVSFTVKGRRNIIGSIKQDRLWAVADLAGFNNTGKNKVSLKVSGLPSSVDFVKEPQDILVELDKVYSVEKNITVTTKGELPKGYAYLTPVVKPVNVKIDGAKRIVNSIYDARVVIDLTNLDSNFTTKEKLLIVDNKGNEIKNLKADVDVIEVSVPIVKTKEVSIKSELIGELPKDVFLGNLTVSPEKVLIVDSDKSNLPDQLKLEAVDLKNVSANMSKKIKIILPDGVKLVNNDGYVDVNIEVKKQITKNISFKNSNIKIKDKKSNFDYEITTDKISFNIVGMEDKINTITNEMLSVSLSVKDLEAGMFSVTPVVSLPEGAKLRGDVPAVTVKVSEIVQTQ